MPTTGSPPLVCLITPGHLASTPRLVKNADALAGAGYRVHVVSCHHYPPADSLDASVFAAARWPHTLLDCRRGPGAVLRKLLRRAARRLILHAPFATLNLATRAHHAHALQLAAVAARVPAQLFLGHCLAGLPAAALAARKRAVLYGFDAEDFHDADTADALGQPAERTARSVLQTHLLSACAPLTAGSPLIARQYREIYGVAPLPLLNVFPLDQAPPAPVDPGPVSARRPARFYWFSQTIGQGRGLEAVIAILGQMRTPVELHLRGFVTGAYAAHLQSHASQAGLSRPVKFLPPEPPAEMVRLSAAADLGLSIEEGRPLNHDLCLGNKIFAYLLAGVPLLLSTTAAQTALAPDLGAAALLGSLDRPEEIARALDAFFADPTRIAAARRTAWDLAQRRFNWNVEQKILLDSVRKVVGPPS